MNTKTVEQIGSRELQRNLKSIKAAVRRGKEFLVLDRAKPVFKIVPIEKTKSKKYTFADLSKFRFSDSPDLSTQIDTVVYEK